jgi:hypothetical protein
MHLPVLAVAVRSLGRIRKGRMPVKRMIAMGMAVLAGCVGVTAAVAPGVRADPPDVSITATFSKAAYQTGDTVSATVTVQNLGTAAVQGVRAVSDFSVANRLVLDSHGWGVLENGVTIAAGGSVTVTVSGRPAALMATTVTLSGNLFDASGSGVATFEFTAPVTLRTAPVSGVVFGDRNANGKPDSGEGLAAAKVTLTYFYGTKQFTATTDSRGHFRLPAVPTARYQMTGRPGVGWHVIPRRMSIPVAGLSGVDVRAVRPLGKSLTAKLHFGQEVYKVGDTAHIYVTLANSSSTPLRGIGAECDHAGNPNELSGTGPGWGNLAFGKPGVVIDAHQTRRFDVTDTVPRAARVFGEVSVTCDFGYPLVEEAGRPQASARALVPGAFGSLTARVISYPNGYSNPPVGVGGTRIVLVNSTRCPLFKRSATTGPRGYDTFANVPAGSGYKLFFFPPTGWKIRFQNPSPAFILGGQTVNFSIEAVHGSARPPTVPSTCS